MSTDEFTGKLALLHSARQRVAENKARKREMIAAFNAEHEELWRGMSIEEAVLGRIEVDVREAAVAIYEADSTVGKTGIPGVTIRESKVVGFDPVVALAWAQAHGVALKLDETAFRKLVLSGLVGMPASVSVEFTAAIAQDLSEVLSALDILEGGGIA